jgi:hypothetical protein
VPGSGTTPGRIKETTSAYDALTKEISELEKKQLDLLAVGEMLSGMDAKRLKELKAQKESIDETAKLLAEMPEALKLIEKETSISIAGKSTYWMEQYEKSWADTKDEVQKTIDKVREFMSLHGDTLDFVERSATKSISHILEISNNKTDKIIQNAEAETAAAIKGLDETLMGQEAYMMAVTALEDDLAEKKKQAALEEAQRAKMFALYTITLATAGAIMKIWLNEDGTWQKKLLLSALVAAEGALQYSAAASAPIPGYAEGREGGDAEFAYTGEEGSEAVKVGSKYYLTPNEKTLTFLPQGASVIPHQETMQMVNEGVQFDGLEKKIDSLIDAIVNKKETSFYITEKGIYTLSKQGNNRTTLLNKLKS